MNLIKLRQSKKPNVEESYYVSFSDLMMLLSVFFVLIISISEVKIGSFEKIKTGFSGSTEGTLVELASELKYMIEKDPGIANVKVELTNEGVLVDLEIAALFDSASSILKVGTLAPMDIILKKIKGTQYQIDVEGHSDDVNYYRKEGEDIETNWSLSGRRAASVLNYIIGLGIDQKRLRLVGYSNNRPRVEIKNLKDAELEKARVGNRRVSLLIR